MATLSRAVALAALIGAAAGQGAACNIADLFALLTEITTDAECRGGCNDGAGEASCGTDWYPGTADSCTANCGRVYEPFWDECGDMLTSAHMGGMEEMGVFYEHCVEELYPPGTCGTFCNQHTFDCFLAEVQEACCDEGGQNCVSGEDVPEECPIGCALVFPDFMEVCREHVSEQMPASLADFETFTQNCEDNDGEAIIEYLLDLKHKGCTIDLTDGGNNGRRQMQFLGQWIGSQQETCPWDTMDDLAREVDEICCGIDGSDCIASPANDNCDAAEDDCQDGLICDLIGPGEHDCLFPSFTEPPTCTPGCAIMLREFNHTCGETVQVLLGGGDVAHAIHAEVGAVAAGWTVDTVTEAMPSRAGAAGMVHGPFGSDVTDVEIDIHIPAGVERCEITWTSWSIDSRDGESDRLAVNDDVVWEKAAHASCAGWEHGPSEFVQQWGGDDDICMSVESVEVMCSGMLHLHFQSDIDQALADEGWAFSDVHVHPFGREDRLNTLMNFDNQCMDEAEANMDFIFHAIDTAICPGDGTDMGGGTTEPECFEVVCGSGDSGCGGTGAHCAEPLDTNAVGCCADSAVAGFTHVCTDRQVWGERDTHEMACNHEASWAEAEVFCAAMGGRLCTQEEMAGGCTRGTGCQHDSDMLWTSTEGHITAGGH